MICRSCLRKGASFLRHSIPSRTFTSSISRLDAATASPRTNGPPAATSTGAAQPFSTPLSPTPNPVSLGESLKPNPKSSSTTPLPTSISPAGQRLKGINYIKGKDDPLALEEDQYPDWLWRCLDVKAKDTEGEVQGEGDEFSKSKKLRQKAAKRQRKLEAKLLASGNLAALEPKIPITRQSVDLEPQEMGELKKAMRRERRAGIKEGNYLKGM